MPRHHRKASSTLISSSRAGGRHCRRHSYRQMMSSQAIRLVPNSTVSIEYFPRRATRLVVNSAMRMRNSTGDLIVASLWLNSNASFIFPCAISKDEVDKYLDIAGITDMVNLKTSSDDVEELKPAPDIFEVVLKKLKIDGADAVAIGDTPYDAEAAGKAKISTIGMLCGGFPESSLRQAGCVEIYPGPLRCSLASQTV